jgi:hypothetical protein
MSLKNDILNELVKTDLLNGIVNKRVLNSLSSIYASDEIWINKIFSPENIPSTAYKSDLKSSDSTENASRIISCISSIYNSANNAYLINKNLVDVYNIVYERIKTRLPYAKDIISNLLGYTCINIDNGFSNQTKESFCGKIGKYITLPFFISSASLYNDNLTITEYSSDEIQFSNIGLITKLPLITNPSIKIKSKNPSISYRMTLSLVNAIKTNAIYFKASANINKIIVTYSKLGVTQYSSLLDSNEILFTFDQIDCDTIIIELSTVNTNTDKPSSIQIEDIHIFKDIQFSRFGLFESKNTEIGLTKEISRLSLSYNALGYNFNNINSMLSISSNKDVTSYNNVYKDDDLDVTSYRLKYAFGFKETDLVTKTISGKDFYSLEIGSTDQKWDMNYKKSSIIYGLNKDYLSFSASGSRYNNWTLSGNYYTTFLLNYYDNVYVNIGSLKCLINNKEYTGNIKIPIGFSVIQVHQMNMDFNIDLFDGDTTRNQYNFAYLFSGLPAYNAQNKLTIDERKTKSFDISSTNTIEFGESFIPLTEIILDNYGNEYSLTLSSTPNLQGTYTIEPFTGRLRINPIGTVKYITASYIAAQSNRRPVGIMFNRLLTFADINSLQTDDTLFSFDGANSDSSPSLKRYIILPKIQNQYSSQILYNLNSDSLFSSVKIKMSTDNKYKTPTINSVYISVK